MPTAAVLRAARLTLTAVEACAEASRVLGCWVLKGNLRLLLELALGRGKRTEQGSVPRSR